MAKEALAVKYNTFTHSQIFIGCAIYKLLYIC